MTDALGQWAVPPLSEVSELLARATVPWWLAGGWALDTCLGRFTRTHSDVDVLVLRPHLPQLRECLSGWDLHAADPPGTLRPWRTGDELPSRVHDVWCRPGPNSPWRLQLMVDDLACPAGGPNPQEEAPWVYRRDGRIRRPWRSLTGPASTDELPVLAPEVQLLYKSHAPRPKDEADFQAVREHLEAPARLWLRRALSLVAPEHAWTGQLTA